MGSIKAVVNALQRRPPLLPVKAMGTFRAPSSVVAAVIPVLHRRFLPEVAALIAPDRSPLAKAPAEETKVLLAPAVVVALIALDLPLLAKAPAAAAPIASATVAEAPKALPIPADTAAADKEKVSLRGLPHG